MYKFNFIRHIRERLNCYNIVNFQVKNCSTMNYQYIYIIFMIGIMFCLIKGHKEILFDFTTVENVDNWKEISDTVRTVGKSKAVLVLQTTQIFQYAVFFTLLNPQLNGAGFAGIRTITNLNLSNFKNVEINCRGQGSNIYYKVVLRHKGLHSNKDITYEQFFTAPMSNIDFSTVILPLKNFKPYYRGREVPDVEPLDTANITMFGLQMYGGVYLPIKQKGVSALEVINISAS